MAASWPAKNVLVQAADGALVAVAMLSFLTEAFVISLSGALAPGPITAVVVGRGARSRHAGAWVAVGHGMVEIPLMAVVFAGMAQVLQWPSVRTVVSALGGAVLMQMGIAMFRLAYRADPDGGCAREPSPIRAGFWLSLTSPYFLLWWATVGASLISRAAAFGMTGFVAFAAVHWLSDLGWCEFLSNVSFLGKRFFGSRFQQLAFGLCGGLLCVFGVRLLIEALGRFVV